MRKSIASSAKHFFSAKPRTTLGRLLVCASCIVPSVSPQELAASGGELEIVKVSDGPGSGYGTSVLRISDIDGDGVRDTLVGAPYQGTDSFRSGAVLALSSAVDRKVYELNGSRDGGGFGFSLTGCDDQDEDGLTDFIVGCPFPTRDGAGYVQVRSARTGASIAEMRGEHDSLAFGTVVRFSSNLGASSVPGVIIGAPEIDGRDRMVTDRGRIVAYCRDAGGWVKAWESGSPRTGDSFGKCVALLDINCDGVDDVIVGASKSGRHSSPRSGRIYALDGLDGQLVWQVERASAGFGTSVGSADDMNADGVPDIVVGDPRDVTNDRSGCVFIMSGRDGKELAAISAPATVRFGQYVCVLDDIDSDRSRDIGVVSFDAVPDAAADLNSVLTIVSGASGIVLLRRELPGVLVCDISVDCEAIGPSRRVLVGGTSLKTRFGFAMELCVVW